jgi:hypothetical protein
MTENDKLFIDNLTYKQMLNLWRFSEIGNPLFMGETGEYFSDRMFKLKKEVDHVKISKEIGWE